jgi:hypothetical protein
MFFDQPESVEPDCDAPPYPIVRACRRLGFRSPEDVRWCRITPSGPAAARQRSMFSLEGLKSIFAKPEPPRGPTCVCGHGLPGLDRCSFTLASGKQVDYLLGQCPRCRSIFWQEVQPDLLAR